MRKKSILSISSGSTSIDPPVLQTHCGTSPGRIASIISVSDDVWDTRLSLMSTTTYALSPYVGSTRKRVFDATFATVMLILFVPLLAGIALAVKFSSPGPVLFRQTRTGLNGELFEIFKFRSMFVQSSDEKFVRQAVREDDRVTPVGRFIRRTSLDELPQLLNVLRGEMSVVGPRPHAVSHDIEFAKTVPEYRARFEARPGLTGIAQISGARGITPTVSAIQERTCFDLEYIRSATLLIDTKIIFMTVREIYRSESAF